jgi:hypothetical protein
MRRHKNAVNAVGLAVAFVTAANRQTRSRRAAQVVG